VRVSVELPAVQPRRLGQPRSPLPDLRRQPQRAVDTVRQEDVLPGRQVLQKLELLEHESDP